MAEKRTEQAADRDKVVDVEEAVEPVDSGYELDLDDTISAWDQVVEEAVAAVGKKGDAKSADAGEPREAAETAVADEEAHEAAAEEEARAPREDDDTAVKELRDRLLRTLADFDNYRKRAEREKVTIQRYALFDVLKDFLDVSDNLERALAASGSADDLKQGVGLIARQFADLLRRYGVEHVEAVGKIFDPMEHEAVSRVESDEVEEPTVVSELQRGYRLHDRLLRPAMVSVAMPIPRPEQPDDESTSEDSRSEDITSEDSGSEDSASEEIAQTTEVN